MSLNILFKLTAKSGKIVYQNNCDKRALTVLLKDFFGK